MNKHSLHVKGLHCASCKILIEDILNEQQNIHNAVVDLKNNVVVFETELEQSAHELATMLTEKIKNNGYVLSVEKLVEDKKPNNVFFQALPIGLVFLALFILLQKSGVLNFGLGGSLTPLTGFIIGLIASVSSCLAVVGGLILSLSAQLAEDDKNNKKPFVIFHLGRLFGFTLLGGLLGFIGKEIGINYTVSAILGLIASTVMVLLGLNLIGVFKKSTITLPASLFSFFRKIEHQTLTPLLLGVGTFFLPCGFTQSMQVAALSSGSLVTGASIMLFFALGTLPMLSLLSFSSLSFARSRYAPLFFATAGIIVIGLGTISILAGLAGLSIIPPLFTL